MVKIRILEKNQNFVSKPKIWSNTARKWKEHILNDIFRPYHFEVLTKNRKKKLFFMHNLLRVLGVIFTQDLLSVLTQPLKNADTIFKNRFFPYLYMTSSEHIKKVLLTN